MTNELCNPAAVNFQKEEFIAREFNLETVHPSWKSCLKLALKKINTAYLQTLYTSPSWLPGHDKIFNAFSLPLNKTQYILFGESPYPRQQSANGYAFWDDAVTALWSETGMSKPVNRATSLRHLIKMMLIAEGVLDPKHTTQPDIAKVDKSGFVQTNAELFGNFLHKGFLLLNATPVLQKNQVKKDAIAWQKFIKHILDFLFEQKPDAELVLFGNIANAIDKLVQEHPFKKLCVEHPYNISFVQNPEVIAFFKPLHLLQKRK